MLIMQDFHIAIRIRLAELNFCFLLIISVRKQQKKISILPILFRKWGFRVENFLGWKLHNFFDLYKGFLFVIGLRYSVG